VPRILKRKDKGGVKSGDERGRAVNSPPAKKSRAIQKNVKAPLTQRHEDDAEVNSGDEGGTADNLSPAKSRAPRKIPKTPRRRGAKAGKEMSRGTKKEERWTLRQLGGSRKPRVH
jgi:hypothetical protein